MSQIEFTEITRQNWYGGGAHVIDVVTSDGSRQGWRANSWRAHFQRTHGPGERSNLPLLAIYLEQVDAEQLYVNDIDDAPAAITEKLIRIGDVQPGTELRFLASNGDVRR